MLLRAIVFLIVLGGQFRLARSENIDPLEIEKLKEFLCIANNCIGPDGQPQKKPPPDKTATLISLADYKAKLPKLLRILKPNLEDPLSAILWQISMSPADAKKVWRRNATRMTYDSFHGTQIEYSTAGGKTYLWYPGNPVILPGAWKTETEQTVSISEGGKKFAALFGVICGRFGANTYNPATGVVGSQWECEPAGKSELRTVDRRDGDVFGLAQSKAVPFVLPKDRTSLDEVLAKAKAARAAKP